MGIPWKVQRAQLAQLWGIPPSWVDEEPAGEIYLAQQISEIEQKIAREMKPKQERKARG